ncbi:MAG: nuclear transport factor 2 family protein [Sphingomonadales bacterium]|nr:MAG: nuclear transport factor 2 family protein [Sphingomonadales bacterium]
MRLIRAGLLAMMMMAAPAMAAERVVVPAVPAAAVPDSRIDAKHLQDVMELQRLKALYFYHLDHKNWDAWRALFTDDASLSVDRETAEGKSTDVTMGMDKVIAYVKERLAVTPSVHHGFTPLYAFPSDTQASGIWVMEDIIHYAADKDFYGYGHYRETYRKENGVWKFASVHLTRLRTDVVDPTKR